MTAPEGYVTVPEAAKMVGCNQATIRNYYRAGYITIARQGLNQVIIAVSEIERIKNGELAQAFIDRRKQEGNPD